MIVLTDIDVIYEITSGKTPPPAIGVIRRYTIWSSSLSICLVDPSWEKPTKWSEWISLEEAQGFKAVTLDEKYVDWTRKMFPDLELAGFAFYVRKDLAGESSNGLFERFSKEHRIVKRQSNLR